MNEFEKWWADPREICPTSETFAESAYLAGQAAERKRCAEIARNSKCGANDQDCSEDRAHDRVCEDIAKAIEGSE